MDDQSNKQIQKVKKVVKKAIIAALRPIIIIFAIICIIVAFICSAMYVITLDTATLKDGSWDNVPYASDQYSNNAQEVWDKLIENNSNIKEYIKESSTFKKLLNAEMVTNFLDTRKDPDAEIDWDSLNQDTNSKEVQGIIKLKRATAEGKTITILSKAT